MKKVGDSGVGELGSWVDAVKAWNLGQPAIPKIMKAAFSESLWFVFAFGAALWLVAPPVSAQSPPALSVQVSNGSVRLRITGDVGSACTIQWATDLSRHEQLAVPDQSDAAVEQPLSGCGCQRRHRPRFYRAFVAAGADQRGDHEHGLDFARHLCHGQPDQRGAANCPMKPSTR